MSLVTAVEAKLCGWHLSRHTPAPPWHPISRRLGLVAGSAPGAVLGPVDWSGRMGPARSQYSDESCTSFAGAFLQETLRRIKDPACNLQYSSEFIWGVERNCEGDFGQNVGCSLEDDLAVLCDYGDCLLATMPDAAGNWSDAPTAAATLEASRYRLVSGARVDYSDLANANAVLAAGQPILLGIQVPNAVFNVGADGLLNDPGVDEPSNGGHAILEVGWRADGRRIWAFRSWGGYGAGGFAFVDPAYAQKLAFTALTAQVA